MGRKKSWFNLVKRFFIADRVLKPDKEKKRKWIFFGKFKAKNRLASIAAPSPSRERRTPSEAEEEQSKRALSVALATAAAAEKAVAAAKAVAEVVLLTGVPQSAHQPGTETVETSVIQTQADPFRLNYQCEKDIQKIAAIKIQTAFRGYLARKALCALRGIVRLQAIIRGRNVRRQVVATLKRLQSIMNIQSEVCTRRNQLLQRAWHRDDDEENQNLRDKIVKMDTNTQRRWDGSILTKKEEDTLSLSKKAAVMKRGRVREYSFGHRVSRSTLMSLPPTYSCTLSFPGEAIAQNSRKQKTFQNSAETERNQVNGRLNYWLDQWVETQVAKSRELEDLDSVFISNSKSRVEYRGKQPKLRGLGRQYHIERLDSPIAAPGRSVHRKQASLGDDNLFSVSAVVPTYMAATESAKAKAKSMSSPKWRTGTFDAYSDGYSPSKNRVSLKSSSSSSTTPAIPSTSSGKLWQPDSYQERSPSFRVL
uniref:Protein IQ-DOMAIN 14 n=1 Tax=Rhizophora mucronata TaxID=61149 RepID=A0A2P2K7G4_RHIMU